MTMPEGEEMFSEYGFEIGKEIVFEEGAQMVFGTFYPGHKNELQAFEILSFMDLGGDDFMLTVQDTAGEEIIVTMSSKKG